MAFPLVKLLTSYTVWYNQCLRMDQYAQCPDLVDRSLDQCNFLADLSQSTSCYSVTIKRSIVSQFRNSDYLSKYKTFDLYGRNIFHDHTTCLQLIVSKLVATQEPRHRNVLSYSSMTTSSYLMDLKRTVSRRSILPQCF